MSNQPTLYGLVLVGGKSRRMQKDKAALNYHGKEQVVHCYELLSLSCEKVFISCRRDQDARGLPQIFDSPELRDIGPLAGILSAMKTHQHVGWLVLGCDLPFITNETIAFLIKHRDSTKTATAYASVYNGLPEPLCTIYEPHAQIQLWWGLEKGIKCPRKILINSDAALLKQPNPHALDNINSPCEYEMAMSKLQQ